MPTFADFLLLRAVPSYGGAEVLRARRVGPGGVDATVHLGLFPDNAQVARRIVTVAEGSAQVPHEAVARILEVGRYDGAIYGTAEAAEGVDLAAILEHDRRRGAIPEAPFVIAVTLALSRIVAELHERGDVWAQNAPGLSGLFPAGLRPDAVVLKKDGALVLRVLAGAADDVNKPTPYRAPELKKSRASVGSDVYALVQLMRALLASDINAIARPRVPTRAGVLPTLLVGALQDNPDERPGLDVVFERLRDVFVDNAENQSPAGVIAATLKRDYRALLADDPGREEPDLGEVAALQKKRASIHTLRELMYPMATATAVVPTADSEEHAPTQSVRRHGGKAASQGSDAVGRVFTEEGETNAKTDSSVLFSSDLSISVDMGSVSDGSSSGVFAGPDVGKAAVVDAASATFAEPDDPPTINLRGKPLADASSSAPATAFSDLAAAPESAEAPDERQRTAPDVPAFAAPAFDDDDVDEIADTIKMSAQRGARAVPREITLAPAPQRPKKS